MKGKKNKPLSGILKFIVEAGMLKNVQRSGWSVVGVPAPESVAGHSFRCAVIAYVLACEEGVEPYRVLLMSLFNDIHEARITDLHKMAQRYIDSRKAEDDAFYQQISQLPKSLKKDLVSMRVEYCAQKTKESKIARDADILECLIQAKEYHEAGYQLAKKFMLQAPGFLETKSARKIWQEAKGASLNDWWRFLSKFSR